MLLMVKKKIRNGLYHSIKKYPKANNKYMKDKSKESSYLIYWDVNNLFDWEMSQKLPENGFK